MSFPDPLESIFWIAKKRSSQVVTKQQLRLDMQSAILWSTSAPSPLPSGNQTWQLNSSIRKEWSIDGGCSSTPGLIAKGYDSHRSPVSHYHHHLVGGFNQPLWKMMEFVSWDDFQFPTVSGKSNKIPWFQSPPTSHVSSPHQSPPTTKNSSARCRDKLQPGALSECSTADPLRIHGSREVLNWLSDF